MPGVRAIALALALGPLAAGLTACGGGSSDKLIPPQQAADLEAALSQVSDNAAAHNCDTATAATDQVQQIIDSLPSTVDRRIRRNLTTANARLKALTSNPATCAAATPTTPTVTTQTTPTVTTQTTPTQTQTTPTQTTPTTPSGGGGTGGTGGTGGGTP